MNSFIGWVGGKKLLREAIHARFPVKIERYVEVFGGAGWVLFYKDKHAPFEVYNDINGELVNLFRCMKHHPDAVVTEMTGVLNARETFNTYKKQDTSTLTDIQRAARYMYLIKASYGSKVGTFGAKARQINKFDNIKHVQERLSTVIIEHKGYDALIKQYDRPETLFYCDPPYFGTEAFYDTGDFVFDQSQHIKLHAQLSTIKGKFILSYNDCPFIRDLYKGFTVEAIERQNNLACSHGKGQLYKELLIKNY